MKPWMGGLTYRCLNKWVDKKDTWNFVHVTVPLRYSITIEYLAGVAWSHNSSTENLKPLNSKIYLENLVMERLNIP